MGNFKIYFYHENEYLSNSLFSIRYFYSLGELIMLKCKMQWGGHEAQW